MVWSRRLLAVLLGLALFTISCSGDDGDTGSSDSTESATSSTDASSSTSESTTTAAPTTSEAATGSSDAGTDDPAGDDTAADAVAVELGEWFVDMPTTLDAGTISFSLSNVGENPHAFAVAKGTSYEELPQLDNGAVDTDALGADFLGSIDDNIAAGGTGEITFDLEPGDYVFFCPIQFGPNSHAAAGQVLSVTVG
jgi:uncharacterized cupredoxin-like copper-binding protein